MNIVNFIFLFIEQYLIVNQRKLLYLDYNHLVFQKSISVTQDLTLDPKLIIESS